MARPAGPAALHMQFVYFLRLSPGDIISVCDKITSRSLGTSSISCEGQQKETSDNSATCTATATLVLNCTATATRAHLRKRFAVRPPGQIFKLLNQPRYVPLTLVY
jgi:predicted phage tail protein